MRGVTIIELLMTIVLITIIAIVVGDIVTEGTRGLFLSKDITVALNLARLELERVRQMDYTNVRSKYIFRYEGFNYDIYRKVSFVREKCIPWWCLKKIEVILFETHSHGTAGRHKQPIVSVVSYLGLGSDIGT